MMKLKIVVLLKVEIKSLCYNHSGESYDKQKGILLKLDGYLELKRLISLNE